MCGSTMGVVLIVVDMAAVVAAGGGSVACACGVLVRCGSTQQTPRSSNQTLIHATYICIILCGA